MGGSGEGAVGVAKDSVRKHADVLVKAGEEVNMMNEFNSSLD